MFLLLLSTLLGFLNVHSHIIEKPIIRWLNRPSTIEKELLKRCRAYKIEQSDIKVPNGRHIKLQRKINAINEEIKGLEIQRLQNGQETKAAVSYGVKAVLSIILFILTIYFRNTPVFIFNSTVDLYPFSKLISYPNTPNTISFHFWVMCCSTIAKLLTLN